MKLHHIVVDDFLEDFDYWRTWADSLSYTDTANPFDGATYPGIYREVPIWGVQQRLGGIMGPIQLQSLFLRLSLKDTPVPHQAHTDHVMGKMSLMVYLNRPEDCRGGTALCRHVDGLEATPTNQADLELWRRDANTPEAWEDYLLCEMRPNRAFIFDADLMHRALPLGGFGDDAQNGRLVLTGFFS